ncbi:MAG TPA: ABC transporter permease [Fibrobacteria bacterium]|nr:ABC transporter permease [Fibrobacteria bacterium]
MRPTVLLRLALRSLRRNKLRTFLTMLGIIIGVGAVIAMLAVGEGARSSVESSIASLGTNVINVYPAGMRGAGGGARGEAGASSRLTAADVEAARREVPALKHVSPIARASAQIKYGGQNVRTQVFGVYPEYLDIRQWELESGSPLSASEERGGAKVALLGRTVAANLFAGEDPVGKTIRIKNLPFRVAGVLKAKGQNSFGQDQDDIIVAPFTTVQRKVLGVAHAQSLIASAVSKESVPEASAALDELLRRRLRVAPGEESAFSVRTQQELSEAMTATSRTLTTLLSSIAAISLLVGGIGIMNIMLVSVTERTREIGIRLAVGARGRDILMQFLVEAVVISVLGGIIGVVLGVGVSTVLAEAQGWAVKVSPSALFLSFAFSAATGVFFGWYPARKAARLNPIEALRYE